MPRSKKRRVSSRSRRSATKPRERGEAQLMRGVRPPVYGFPNTIITKLRYCDTIQQTSTTGSVWGYVFAANGIYDPDISSTGHQPMYRDNFAALYDQYVVLGSKITVTCTNLSTTNGAIIGINGDDDSSGSSTLATKMEQNNSLWSHLGPQGSGQDTVTIRANHSPLRDFGVAVKDDGSSATAVGANPGELWCFQVFGAAYGANTNTFQFSVEIEYTVKFTELQTPVQN